MQLRKFCESFPRSKQTSVRVDIPIIISTPFLHDVQISMRRSGRINVFLWDRECFFLLHNELNSRFTVMTVEEVTL